MSDQLPPCPQCASEFTYESGALLICPMCGHEWVADAGSEVGAAADSGAGEPMVRDSVGNVLADGDTVVVVRDLKVKGAGGAVKMGTKVRGIRLLAEPINDHDIDARVPGFGQMHLKSSVVKKAI